MNIPKPPRRPRIVAPAPEVAHLPLNTSAPAGDDDKATVDMNFKVNPRMRSRVKIQAGARGMTTKAMIEAALEHYWASFPISITAD